MCDKLALHQSRVHHSEHKYFKYVKYFGSSAGPCGFLIFLILSYDAIECLEALANFLISALSSRVPFPPHTAVVFIKNKASSDKAALVEGLEFSVVPPCEPAATRKTVLYTWLRGARIKSQKFHFHLLC